jgi:hypothetical protein
LAILAQYNVPGRVPFLEAGGKNLEGERSGESERAKKEEK